MSLQGNQIIPCHIAVYLLVRVYLCQVLLIRCCCFLKLGRSLNWLLKNVKALVFQTNEPCDTHYYILTICGLVISLLPPFYGLGQGPSVQWMRAISFSMIEGW